MNKGVKVDLGVIEIKCQSEQVYCVADLHLCASRPHEILDFANEVISQIESHSLLVILGDLFDVYIGAEDLRQSAFRPMFEAFDTFAQTGRVIVVRGNRDVLLSPRDLADVSFEVADVVVNEADSHRTLYTHGDAFCTADRAYQRLRKILRNRGVRLLLRMLPGALRRRIGARMRKLSAQEVARKEISALEVNYSAVAATAEAYAAQTVIIGHLHSQQRLDVAVNCELRVLSAWQPRLTNA
ncbi:MAG: UDP-2,3-diacylglucosamine diphosphatase [Planctomycetota bacterium]|nr:UDP-2,3-diacylglucosamine diphosphatase [Planctomycetota bacterium]